MAKASLRSRSSSARPPRCTPARPNRRWTSCRWRCPAGEICVLVGPVRLRQDDRDADGQPPDRHHVGRHPASTAERHRAQAGRAAARDRLRDPADRPVPAPHRGRERRHRAQAARLGQEAHPRPRRRAARADLARPRRGPRPLPRPALRRPAPARRRGPRAGRRPARAADGRAVRRHRPDQPRAPAERVPAPAGQALQDDRLRHPRHRRGDQDGRQDRDPAARAATSPSTRRPPRC